MSKNHVFFAAVTVAAILFAIWAMVNYNAVPTRAAYRGGPTDLDYDADYEVHDTFVCDAGSTTEQIREWHFAGSDRSRRAQQTVDWYMDFDGRKVRRIDYQPGLFPTDGKKYMRMTRRQEQDRRREGFDANGGDDQLRWADVVLHNVKLEPQSVVNPCGPAR